MTEQELQSVINAVLSSIKTNSRSIGQLTGVQTLSDNDCFEVAGGRKVAYSVLRDLIYTAVKAKLENMQTDIANSVLQSVSFDATGSTATLTIKQKGYDAITVNVPIATDSQSGFMTAEQVKYIDDLREDIPNLQNKLDAAHGEVMFADLDKLCTADDMLRGKPACYTVLDTLVTTKGTVTLKVGVLWVYSDNLRHVVMQVLNTNFVLDDDGTFTGKVHNHDVHEYSRTYAYSTAAGTLHTWSKWQEVGGKGIVDRITNVALAKQNKLVAGDDATRLNGAKLSTKQIFTGSIDTTAGAVPMLLPAGGCIYNSADKKLYIGDSNSQPVEVAKPNDFLFFSNGKLYHYQFGNFGEVETGTTLVAGDKATRIDDAANLATKQIYKGTVMNNADVVPTLEVGAYCFNIATKKLYVGAQHDYALVTDTVPMPDDFLFIDTASGTTYRCDGTTLHNIANIKTVNGQSLLGKGNVQLTGADFLLEQDAELTINEAVNSNTKALQNKLNKGGIVHTSFGSGFCYKLSARQIELLEASDVITLEICAQCNGGLNGYNNTAAMGYFSIMFGNYHGALITSYSGQLSYSSDQKKYGQGSGFTYAVDGSVVTCWDRFLVVINRKTGVIRLYDKCSRMVAEKQREEYKSDSWLAGDDWLAIMKEAQHGYVADLWALRIYDRDVEPMKYNNNIMVADNNFVEAILPFQYPSNAKAVQVQDYSFTYKNTGAPYTWPKTRAYDPDDGLLTGTNDTSDWLAVGATGNVSDMANMHVREVDFEVTGGKWRVVSYYRIHVYSCVNAEGTDMGIDGYYEMNKTSAEMPAGRYTMKYVSNWPCDFADIAAGATIKHYGAKIHILHCVANINPRYYCNGQCRDDARQEWWTPLDVNNHSTPVVPTFTDAAWRSVPAPALLSQPSFNGQLKVDDSGKVYVGVCAGATRTWKQINNA